jgi:N6-L-threonylcarbamoyladenine synthase
MNDFREMAVEDSLILAFETSCDETAVSVLRNERDVLSDIIHSQIDIHAEYGGVVPEIASRKHIEVINQVTRLALKEAAVTLDDINAIAVTYGPGLAGSLIVGVSFAKALAFAKDLPLIGVDHIVGHIQANAIEQKDFCPPFVCLVVSGGHSHMIACEEIGEYRVIGRTRDDAAGEAYDKVARALGLGYPGGPLIDAIAREGNAEAICFPRAHVADSKYDFSFSGLKSAVMNHIEKARRKGESIDTADVAASFQKALVDVLAEHSRLAIKDLGYPAFAVAGGVAANSSLRSELTKMCTEMGVRFFCPSPRYSTDNAAMIAVAAYHDYQSGNFADYDLNATPGLRIGGKS